MGEDLNLCLETAVRLAKEAGVMILDAVFKEKCIEMKAGFTDLVTETDQQVEKFLIHNFQLVFPHHKFIGEESVAEGVKCNLTDDPTWIIDPVDGTMNFVHTFPNVAVSIGLAINKEIQVGVVYNPQLDRLFTAQRGKGAHLNGNKIQVSKVTELPKALLLAEVGNASRSPEVLDNIFSNMRTLVPQAHGLRALGSAALDMCTIACGEADVYYEFGLHCWDIAGASVIITEAGGTVLDTSGGPMDLMSRRVLCASCPSLALTVSSQLKECYMERD